MLSKKSLPMFEPPHSMYGRDMLVKLLSTTEPNSVVTVVGSTYSGPTYPKKLQRSEDGS
jgi:hypothetical protein